ncbi:sensor histidine kinase [Ramlibacter sp.]|uniref:sensor histidine kinase n=1 Tax=Ramlibacter sp. TaxID=1917967 RepID=UPI002FC65FED
MQWRIREAEEAIRARDDFLAIAAHELRSPLNALALRLAALERMAERQAEPALRAELQRTRRSVDRYVRRAVFLLDVSRLQSGKLRPVPEWVGNAEIVGEVLDAHRDEAAFHKTTLEGHVEEEVRGFWDRHMIEQVLTNLVSNAFKYGGGTPVRIEAGLAAPGIAAFEVSDEGPGIDEVHRRRIFEKFERVVTPGRESAGFGLGLWIVGRMVAAHHGTIEACDRPGGGALFRVRLPLNHPTNQAQEAHD